MPIEIELEFVTNWSLLKRKVTRITLKEPEAK